MKKKIFRKRFFNNIEAKVSSITVLFLLIIAAFSGIFVLIPFDSNTVKAASANDFDYYKQIWIQSSQVSNDLINFPVWFYHSNADYDGLNDTSFSFFDGIGGGATELNWELEVYDDAADSIGAWVNITSVSSSSNTSFYLFYDDSASNDGGENNPTSVWDSGFEAVWHFDGVVAGDSGTVNDSTSNGNDGTTNNGVTDEQTGMAGDCFDFNFGDSEYINFSAISPLSNYTLEAWGVNDDWVVGTPSYENFISSWKTGADEDWYGLGVYDGDGTDGDEDLQVAADVGNDDGGKLTCEIDCNGISGWRYVAGIRDIDSDILRIHVNQTVNTSSTSSYTSNIVTSQQCIGARGDGGAEYWNGLMDEVRISSVVRNESWVNATFLSISSPSTFLDFGGEVNMFSFTGLDSNNRVTFGSGSAGDTLYSNATGNWGDGAMLTINITIGASIHIEDICLDFVETDLDDTVHWENISISCLNGSNTSWGDFKPVVDIDQGGDASNISLNASWDGTWGDNPFPYYNNSINRDGFINVRFKLELPSDADTGTHTTDSWLIRWKGIE